MRRLAVRVEAQDHVIAGEHVVSLAERGPHLLRVVVAQPRDVEILVVVCDHHFRVDGGLGLVAGIVLGEVADLRRAAPAGVAQVPVDPYRTRRPGDLELRMIDGHIGLFLPRGRRGKQGAGRKNEAEREYRTSGAVESHRVFPLIRICVPSVCVAGSNAPVSYTIREGLGSAAGRDFHAAAVPAAHVPRKKCGLPFPAAEGSSDRGGRFVFRFFFTRTRIGYSSSSLLSWTFARPLFSSILASIFLPFSLSGFIATDFS